MSPTTFAEGPSAEAGTASTARSNHWTGSRSQDGRRPSAKDLAREETEPASPDDLDDIGLHVKPLESQLTWPLNRVMDSKFGTSPWKNLGTGSFLFFAFAGTEVAVYGQTSGQTTDFDPTTVLYIAIAFGISLMVNVFIFFRVSGALFNPAVTLAMLLTRSITPLRCLLLFISQILACMFSSYIVSVLIPTKFGVVTKPSNGCSTAQAVILEMLLTAYLIMSIFMLAGEKHKGRFMAPVSIGMALFSAHLVGVQWTGASLNPARSFGPAVVSGDWTQHWIYWVGPAAGAAMSAGLYKLFKIMRYQEANPGADTDEDSPKSAAVYKRPSTN